MIRRQAGNEYWLITQHEHALISGTLAEKLSLPRSTILGIMLHDCGWPLHDDEPTLNPDHLPLDVFETPREIGLRVWEASADLAARRDPYAGLLVSLHGLNLSVFATEKSKHESWNLRDSRARFDINRFQHKMIELQESLRQRLGLRTDLPLKHGLAEDSDETEEKQLASDFRWLQKLDQVSLVICGAAIPFKASIDVTWPEAIEVEIPFRRVAAKRYDSEAAFRKAYHAAKVERFTAAVSGHTM